MQKSIYSREQEVLQALLRQLRQQAGLKQEELAERLGRSQQFVSRFEAGDKVLDVPELRQICHALGMTLVEFITMYEAALEKAEEQ